MFPSFDRTLIVLAALIFVLCIGIAPVESATLLGLTDTGELFASSDDGVTWSVVGAVPIPDATAIAAGETSAELYLASKSGSVFRSTDSGVTWTAVGTVHASDIVDMAIRTNGDLYLLSKAGTLWLSQDDGVTFDAIAALTASNHVSLTGDTGGGHMYALARTGEVARSTDFGATWNTVGTIATSDAVDVRAVGQTLFVLTGAGDVARSTDHGVTWMTVGTASQVHMVGLTRHESGLVAATRQGLVATSADATSWSFVGSINQVNIVALGNDRPTITGIPHQTPIPSELQIKSVWPNPLGSVGDIATVEFDLSKPASVVFEIYNVRGQLMFRQGRRLYDSGEQQRQVDVRSLPSGVYCVRLVAGSELSAKKKLVVVR